MNRLDPEALYIALDAQRRRLAHAAERRISWREVARDLRISQSTFTRIGVHHESPSASTLIRLLAWLGTTDVAPYITTDKES